MLLEHRIKALHISSKTDQHITKQIPRNQGVLVNPNYGPINKQDRYTLSRLGALVTSNNSAIIPSPGDA